MTTYISMLRGINVSGQKLIKMDALRKLYENLGFINVITYLQSGNVIFTNKDQDTDKLGQIIRREIQKNFGFEVPVIVLTIDKLKQIIDHNPFINDSNKDQSSLYVTFLLSKPDQFDAKVIEDKKQDMEEIIFSDNAVYMYCPDGYGRTKLSNNFFEAKLKVDATTRNWKTTNELYKIVKGN
jgi:uncharacterized protein (DUF1697 family)